MRKSVGAGTTFERDMSSWDAVAPAVVPLDKVWDACLRGEHAGRTVTVKAKYADFRQVTRAQSCPAAIKSREDIGSIALELLRPLFPPSHGVRLLGVTLSGLEGVHGATAAQLAFPLKPENRLLRRPVTPWTGERSCKGGPAWSRWSSDTTEQRPRTGSPRGTR